MRIELVFYFQISNIENKYFEIDGIDVEFVATCFGLGPGTSGHLAS